MALDTAENGHSVPLLPEEAAGGGDIKQSTTRVLAVLILKIIIWVIFIGWISVFFIMASPSGSDLYESYVDATKGSPYGSTGSALLIHSVPIILIALLAVPYLLLLPNEDNVQLRGKKKKKPSFGLHTFPVFVQGPLGVVSAAESIGIILFVMFVLWSTYIYTVENYASVESLGITIPAERRNYMLQGTALSFGLMASPLLAFLFLPVARGSILLRVSNIPFEQAVRYHIWLGHLIMFLLTLHGAFYMTNWILQHILLESLVEWENDVGANLAGVIAYLCGLVMWVTSLPPVRRRYFELFFYTHQLYIPFIIFFVLHIGQVSLPVVAGAMFLFMLDRFLRFFQSKRKVSVILASNFSCEFVELVFSKPGGLQYNALSFIFLRVRELSALQWHPFSVSSSPLDGNYHLSVLIKAAGSWTSELKERIKKIQGKESLNELPFQFHPNITAFVEGPYSHESSSHLLYENLILVAGGSGISPFLAVMSDILHRVKIRRPCLPRNILLIWAVKNSNELSLLHSIDMESIVQFSNRLCVDIRAYVTQEQEPPFEEGHFDTSIRSSIFPIQEGQRSISPLVGTGSIIWCGVYVLSSTVGFIILLGLLDLTYINPLRVSYWWYRGILLLACMALSVVIFGGIVIYLWHNWEERHDKVEKVSSEESVGSYNAANGNRPVETGQRGSMLEKLGTSSSIVYGRRPDFKEIFGSISTQWGDVNVGVIVCGPSTLESSVALECRSLNVSRNRNMPIFHFNSHNFQLYENLILVAGGSGISAFLAVMSDILHRVKDRRPCLPRNIMLIWAVKNSKDLSVQHSIDMESITQSSNGLSIDIRLYITPESESPLEECNFDRSIHSSIFPIQEGQKSISPLVGRGSIIWCGVYVLSSTVGFIILLGLLDLTYINPLGISCWVQRDFIMCMALIVVIFGVIVIYLWHIWEERNDKVEKVGSEESVGSASGDGTERFNAGEAWHFK